MSAAVVTKGSKIHFTCYILSHTTGVRVYSHASGSVMLYLGTPLL